MRMDSNPQKYARGLLIHVAPAIRITYSRKMFPLMPLDTVHPGANREVEFPP